MAKFIRLLVIFQVIVLFISCNRSHYKDVGIITYSYSIDETDAEFGYKYFSEVSVISPRSIFQQGDFIYITDPINQAINRINITTGYLTKSEVFQDNLGYINDVVAFENTIFASTDNGNIVKLDSSLRILEIQKLAETRGKFYEYNNVNFTIYFPAENHLSMTIDNDGNLLAKEYTPLNYRNRFYGTKVMLSEGGDTLINGSDRIGLSIPYKRLEYGGINSCLSESFFCFFLIEENLLSVHIQNLN